jgi:hypothetical protein
MAAFFYWPISNISINHGYHENNFLNILNVLECARIEVKHY